MRRWFVMLAALLLAGPATAMAAEPPEPVADWMPPRRPNIVILTSVDGILPGDSTAAHAFMAGVREAFEPEFYLTEGVNVGPPRVSMALANRFQLVHGDPFGDEWRVQLTIDGEGQRTGDRWSRPRDGFHDSLSILIIHVRVLSPEAVRSRARSDLVIEELAFDLPFEPRAARLSHAGRAAGLLAVEVLHHRSGDLAPDTRVRIDHTVRRPVEFIRSPHYR